MWVEVFVENFWRLFAEIATVIIFSSFFNWYIDILFTWSCDAFVEHPGIATGGSSPAKASCSSSLWLSASESASASSWLELQSSAFSNDSHRFTSGLLQLNLDRVELLVDDIHLVMIFMIIIRMIRMILIILMILMILIPCVQSLSVWLDESATALLASSSHGLWTLGSPGSIDHFHFASFFALTWSYFSSSWW